MAANRRKCRRSQSARAPRSGKTQKEKARMTHQKSALRDTTSMSTAADPVIASIAKAKAAWAAQGAADRSRVERSNPAHWQELNDAVSEAETAVANARPTTFAGLIAQAKYMAWTLEDAPPGDDLADFMKKLPETLEALIQVDH